MDVVVLCFLKTRCLGLDSQCEPTLLLLLLLIIANSDILDQQHER